jgi:hypothetical protein
VSDSTIDYESLKTLSGQETPAGVRNWLSDNKIRFLGKRRPFTTTEAINSAMGINPAIFKKRKPIEF